jgi:hypothetical protein
VNRSGMVAFGAVACLTLGACTPEIVAVTVQPTTVCRDSMIAVHWQFKKGLFVSGILTTNAPGARTIQLGVSGETVIPVPQTMLVSVVAKRLFWRTPPKLIPVVVRLVADSMKSFNVRDLPGDPDSMRTIDILPWDVRFRIQTVRNVTIKNGAIWPIRLIHDGASVVLADSNESTAFRGLSGTGEWQSRIPMTNAGSSDNPGAVRLRVTFICDSVSGRT